MISNDVIEAAKSAQQKYGVPASVSIAQFGLESAWGTKMPKGSNNPFGIKAVADQPFVSARTVEFYHGVRKIVTQNFAKFASFAEAFEAHAKLLATSKYYVKARQHLNDPDAYANALTGVYATDPHYGAKLIGIMKTQRLYTYNEISNEPKVASTVPPVSPGGVSVSGPHGGQQHHSA